MNYAYSYKKTALILLLFFLVTLSTFAQTFSLMTWNIQDLGRSKDATEIDRMVEAMRDYDIVAIQEVVAKDPAGARAVATLADLLNRTGAKWDYRVSDPTHSPSSYISERYAYLWKTSKVRLLGRAYLDKELEDSCDREPYIAHFQLKSTRDTVVVVNFHARRFDNAPEAEIQHFEAYPARLGTEKVLIVGDFNLDETHVVWRPLYNLGFQPTLQQTPTTLKRKCAKGAYVNYPIDNIYFASRHFELAASGCIDLVKDCESLVAARGVSDHLPVFVRLRTQSKEPRANQN